MEETDIDAVRMLRLLDEETPALSTVDAGTLLRASRQRVRFRRALRVGGAAGLTAVALAVVPLAVGSIGADRHGDPVGAGTVAKGTMLTSADPAPDPPRRCTVQHLPVPPGAVESEVLDGDPTGRYLVGVARNSKTGRVWTLMWDRGRPTVLSPPASDSQHLAVSSRGVVAGDGLLLRDGISELVAWIYQGGQYRRLPTLDRNTGASLSVVDINNRGDILGTGALVASAGTTPGRRADRVATRGPVVWPANDPATVRELAAPPGGGFVQGTGIADDGTVVGVRLDEAAMRPGERSAGSHGVVWGPDGVRDLPLPQASGPGSAALAIGGSWVAGWYQDPASRATVLARWNLRNGDVHTVRGLPWLSGVNRHGWVTGLTRDAGGFEMPAVAFDDRVLVLPVPTGAEQSKEGPAAVTISDDGAAIAGNVMMGNAATSTAVRWSCS
jgi:hypothetical protein